MDEKLRQLILDTNTKYVEKAEKAGIKYSCVVYIHTCVDTYDVRVGYFEEYYEADRWYSRGIVPTLIAPKEVCVMLNGEMKFHDIYSEE